MHYQRLLTAAPYAILLAVVAWFYRIAGTIEFSRQGNNFGPDFWPQIVLAALMAVCAVQIVRIIFAGGEEARTADDGFEAEEAGQRSYALLALGLALTVAYGFMITPLGFLTATALYLALFMYVGRYRAHLAIWLSSLIGAAALTLVFQKAVYVSLPRGLYPFDLMTDGLLSLF